MRVVIKATRLQLMTKKPNVPMSNPITTCNQPVDKEKYDEGWDRIFGHKEEEEHPAFKEDDDDATPSI